MARPQPLNGCQPRHNQGLGLAGSRIDWMRAYAGLVTDPQIRERIFARVRKERARTGAELDRLLESRIAERRPRFRGTLQNRQAGSGEGLREAQLLGINPIASGPRTTG